MAILKRITHATRILGAPPNWKPEGTSVLGLPIVDCYIDGNPFMVSAWELDPRELQALRDGETLKLWVSGQNHPVVSITVGELD